MKGPSIHVSAPEGLEHFPQMPTPQLVMYSIAPIMRSSGTISFWISKQRHTICSGPQLMKAIRCLSAADSPATTSFNNSGTYPWNPALPSSVAR